MQGTLRALLRKVDNPNLEAPAHESVEDARERLRFLRDERTQIVTGKRQATPRERSELAGSIREIEALLESLGLDPLTDDDVERKPAAAAHVSKRDVALNVGREEAVRLGRQRLADLRAKARDAIARPKSATSREKQQLARDLSTMEIALIDAGVVRP